MTDQTTDEVVDARIATLKADLDFLDGVAGPDRGHYGLDVVVARGLRVVGYVLLAIEGHLREMNQRQAATHAAIFPQDGEAHVDEVPQ